MIIAALVLLFNSCLESNATKLLIVPGNIDSHVIYFGRLAETLSQLGYSTHLLVASNARISSDLVKAAAASTVIGDTGGTSARVAPFTIERYAVDGNVSFTNSPAMTEVRLV